MGNHWTVQQWRESVRVDQKNKTDRAISNHALDAFERLATKTAFTSADLQPILRAARSKHLTPMYVGMDLLTALIKHQVVRDEWLKLAQSSYSHERWAAVTMLFDSRIPKSFTCQVVRKALNDKSTRVRIFAAERALSRRLTRLLPDMKARLVKETNSKVAYELQWCIDLLEHGYHVESNGGNPEKLDITIALPGGYITWDSVTQYTLKRKGIKKILEEAAKDVGVAAN